MELDNTVGILNLCYIICWGKLRYLRDVDVLARLRLYYMELSKILFHDADLLKTRCLLAAK